MAEDYLEYRFTVYPKNPWEDILLSQLQQLPFDSFLSTEEGLNAYLPKKQDKESLLDSVVLLNHESVQIEFTVTEIPPENWNAKWESEFQPIFVGSDCVIRADFHESQGKTYELIINPKMSFGTGHHPTTHMMMEFVLEETLSDKTVLDMGCGTGVLGILASKKGTRAIDAMDSDAWCVENTIENAKTNGCKNIRSSQAAILESTRATYDAIFANINRNVLLEQIPSYGQALKVGGSLFLSGFYKNDINFLQQSCQKENLTLISTKEKEQWCALKFIK
jgi:ribosomal protein L11 methyltransferase